MRLRVRTPAGEATIDTLLPTSTVDELYEAVVALNLVQKPFSILVGFPPTTLQETEPQPLSAFLCENDSIRVQQGAPGAAPKQAQARKRAAPKSKGPSGSKKRAKKSAAKEATPARRGIHTLNGAVNSAPKPRRRKRVNLESKDQVGESLLRATMKGTQKVEDRFMRAAFRGAVHSQYEVAEANHRLAAALGNHYRITLAAPRLGGGPGVMDVEYKAGVRKWNKESLELLPREMLPDMLRIIIAPDEEAGLEMLKPHNLSLRSPKLFWSIVYAYGGDVQTALPQILPTQDWDVLDRRARRLSEKAVAAKESEEYEQQRKQQKISKIKEPAPEELPPATDAEEPKDIWRRCLSCRKYRRLAEEVPGRGFFCDMNPDPNYNSCEAPQEAQEEPTAASAPTATTSDLDAVRHARLRLLSRTHELSVGDQGRPAPEAGPRDALDEVVPEDVSQDLPDEVVLCDSCDKSRIVPKDLIALAHLDEDPWTCSRLADLGRTNGCAMPDDLVVDIVGEDEAVRLEAELGVNSRRALATAEGVNPAWVAEARQMEESDVMADIADGDMETLAKLADHGIKTPADLERHSPRLLALIANHSWLNESDFAAWIERAQEAVANNALPWI